MNLLNDAHEVVFSTNGRFPFGGGGGGGLRKMVTSFLFLATLNFLNGPLADAKRPVASVMSQMYNSPPYPICHMQQLKGERHATYGLKQYKDP